MDKNSFNSFSGGWIFTKTSSWVLYEPESEPTHPFTEIFRNVLLSLQPEEHQVSLFLFRPLTESLINFHRKVALKTSRRLIEFIYFFLHPSLWIYLFRLTIMNNILPSSITMHLKFDLKGSTYKRKVFFFIL